jgi:integrase
MLAYTTRVRLTIRGRRDAALTGRGLKWFDLDCDRGLIQVRKTKTRHNRVVPMNARVREVFNRQRRFSEFVFTSTKTGGRLIDVKKGFQTARIAAGIPDFR